MQISRELMSPMISSYVTMPDEGNLIAVLLNVVDPALRKETVERLVRRIKRAGLNAMCGVSSCAAQLDQLRMCFIEAVSALNAAGEETLIFYEDLQMHSAQVNRRLIETDALEAALRAGSLRRRRSI